MKLVTSLLQGKTASLEDGSAKCRSNNEYRVLHRDESKRDCGRFVQIAKVILCIELTILIGWLGFVSFSWYAASGIRAGKSHLQADGDSTPMRDRRFFGKRSVAAEEISEPISTQCWSQEEVRVLEKEREERMDAFVFRRAQKEADESLTKAYLESIEAALNATSISEINSVHYPRKSQFHRYIELLSENSSLELRKEGCEINRDLHLEFNRLKNFSPEWEDYNVHRIHPNRTTGHFFAVNLTKEAFFDDIGGFSNAFDLFYEVLDVRENGNETMKPVFGKFRYVGEEPETLGIRHLRHILNAVIEFYFKTQEPSSICKGATTSSGLESKPNNTNNTECRNMEQDPAFLEERRDRLEAYRVASEKYVAENLYTKNFIEIIQQALNATNASEIHFDESLLRSVPLLRLVEYYTSNASLDLHKEALMIVRDLYLEIEELKDHTPEWDGYDFNAMVNNVTERSEFNDKNTIPLTIFEDFTNFDRAFDLRYDGNLDSENFVLGKVNYYGEGPEHLGVRHIRHILDGVVRSYFKVRHPLKARACYSSAEEKENSK